MPTSYRPLFEFSSGEIAGNAQRFATEEEAQSSAYSRYLAWTMPTGFRTEATDDPVNYRWDAIDGDVPLD